MDVIAQVVAIEWMSGLDVSQLSDYIRTPKYNFIRVHVQGTYSECPTLFSPCFTIGNTALHIINDESIVTNLIVDIPFNLVFLVPISPQGVQSGPLAIGLHLVPIVIRASRLAGGIHTLEDLHTRDVRPRTAVTPPTVKVDTALVRNIPIVGLFELGVGGSTKVWDGHPQVADARLLQVALLGRAELVGISTDDELHALALEVFDSIRVHLLLTVAATGAVRGLALVVWASRAGRLTTLDSERSPVGEDVGGGNSSCGNFFSVNKKKDKVRILPVLRMD